MFLKRLSLLLFISLSAIYASAQAVPESWMMLKKTDGSSVSAPNPEIVLLDGMITINGGEYVFDFEEVNSFHFGNVLSVTDLTVQAPKVYVDASGNLIVSGNSPIGSIYVYSLAGQLLRYAETGENEFSIPVSGFTKGVYLVKIDGRTVKIIR
jgi:hypothetical protein